MRRLELLAIAAAGFSLSSVSPLGADPPASMPVPLKAECSTADQSEACSRCEITLKDNLEVPSGDRSFAWSCPKMAAGQYELKITIPVRLVPPTPTSPLFSQLLASFTARARGAGGYARDLPLEEAPMSWSWWGDAAAVIQKTARIAIEKDADIDVDFKVKGPAYYVPRQTQGPARHDGTIVIEKAAFSLRREAAEPAVTADPGTPRVFGAETLAQILPGKTTKAEVEALLGRPWRASEPDADESEPGVWEYRGRDATDTYRVHIEFDGDGVATLITKIPDSAKETQVTGEDRRRARSNRSPAAPGSSSR